VKRVGDGEILETYLNSASKNTSQTDIFPHGTKFLLNIVIGDHQGGFQHSRSTTNQIFCICQILEKKMGIELSSASALFRF
jgi:hypothetical protein